METVKDVLYFCNAAIFYDYKNIGIIEELNQARRCIFNIFPETIPVSIILLILSIIDVLFLKNNDNNIENIIENIHVSRADILYTFGFENLLEDDVDKLMN